MLSALKSSLLATAGGKWALTRAPQNDDCRRHHADTVVVMEAGRVAHVGTYEELLAKGVDIPKCAAEGGSDEGAPGTEGAPLARQCPL